MSTSDPSRTLLEADLDWMTRLHRVSSLFVSEGDQTTAVLDEIVEAAIAICGADMGNIQILERESGELRIAAQRGFERWYLDFWDAVGPGRGTCGTALERGERVIVENVEDSPIFADPRTLAVQLDAGVRAVVSTPVMSRAGELVGVFSAHYREPHRPDDRALRMLDLLARETANIIELARNTQALRRSERAAGEATRAREEILAVVAHDLRAPLATVLGAAQSLAADMKSLPAEPPTERMLKSVGSIRRSVARMIRLTNDLLDLNSIDAHQLHLEIRPEPPRELVAEAVDAHRAAAAEHCIPLVVSVEEGLPFVRCDRERLSQVFANLLTNAFKYSPPATTVTIAAAHEEGCVRFSVADQGVGIAEPELPHVFDRYWRGAVSAGRSRGLGLAIVKGIIDGHGGRVGVTSQVGKGSTFFFALPSVVE